MGRITNDPSALVDLHRWNGGFLFDERLYALEQKNRMLANKVRSIEGLDPVGMDGKYVGRTRMLTVADSSEPKSIAEIDDCGVKIIGAPKWPDSVHYGIQLMQGQKFWVTARSVNLIKELRNYTWKVDKKTGKGLNVPVDDWNHALDAGRYGVMDVMGGKKSTFRVRTAQCGVSQDQKLSRLSGRRGVQLSATVSAWVTVLLALGAAAIAAASVPVLSAYQRYLVLASIPLLAAGLLVAVAGSLPQGYAIQVARTRHRSSRVLALPRIRHLRRRLNLQLVALPLIASNLRLGASAEGRTL